MLKLATIREIPNVPDSLIRYWLFVYEYLSYIVSSKAYSMLCLSGGLYSIQAHLEK